jgi:hypothetical protein
MRAHTVLVAYTPHDALGVSDWVTSRCHNVHYVSTHNFC